MASEEKWGRVKWILGIGAAAVIGAVSLRMFDRHIAPRLPSAKKDADDNNDVEGLATQAAVVESQASMSPLVNPAYQHALTPILPWPSTMMMAPAYGMGYGGMPPGMGHPQHQQPPQQHYEQYIDAEIVDAGGEQKNKLADELLAGYEDLEEDD